MQIKFIEKAIEVAENSGKDLPIGAVITCGQRVLAVAHNEVEAKCDPTRHAEMVAIANACKQLASWRLDGCQMYVTLEPCPMCAWAIAQARIKTVYFGAYDPLYGGGGSVYDFGKTQFKGGILEEKCQKLLQNYFKKVRDEKIS